MAGEGTLVLRSPSDPNGVDVFMVDPSGLLKQKSWAKHDGVNYSWQSTNLLGGAKSGAAPNGYWANSSFLLLWVYPSSGSGLHHLWWQAGVGWNSTIL